MCLCRLCTTYVFLVSTIIQPDMFSISSIQSASRVDFLLTACHPGIPFSMTSRCKHLDGGGRCPHGCQSNRVLCHRFVRQQCYHMLESRCRHGLHARPEESGSHGRSSSSQDGPRSVPNSFDLLPNMDQVFLTLKHHMLQHYQTQGTPDDKKKVKASYLMNFHSDRWRSSCHELDDLAGRLTRWCNDSLCD